MNYPSDNNWLVRAGRFLNILDADANMLSPTRVQAWIATVQAAGVGLNDFLTHHTDAVQSTMALVWAGMAHVLHQTNKAAVARRDGGPDVRP
jgi:hypothetical protein